MTRMGWKKIEEPYLHGYELYVSSAAQVQVIRHFPCDWRCYLIVDGCAYKEGEEEAGKSFLNRKCCELYAMNKYHDFIYDQHKGRNKATTHSSVLEIELKTLCRELNDVREWMESNAIEEMNIRLQAFEPRCWSLRTVDASYDDDHRGFWGASSIRSDDNDDAILDVANELIDQAEEDYSSCERTASK